MEEIDWNNDEAVVKAAQIKGYLLFADISGRIWMMSEETGAQGLWGENWKDARMREAVQGFERGHNPAYARLTVEHPEAAESKTKKPDRLATALRERDILQLRLDAILSHNPNAEPRIREWTEADERAAYPERFGLPHHGSKEAK